MRRKREKILCIIIVPLIIIGCIFLEKQLPSPRASTQPQRMKHDLSVETMYLTVLPGNSEITDHTWEEINTYSKYYYNENGLERYQVNALLQVGDENGPLPDKAGYGQTQPNATVHIRGNTASKTEQKSYQIKFNDKTDKWNGQNIINLNKHQLDGFRFSNKLMYDIMDEVPYIMSVNTRFVHLLVKDSAGGKTEFEDYGLFTHVDQVNKDWLKANDLDENGHLYKENILFEFRRYEDDIRRKTDPLYDEAAFSQHLVVKGSSDHKKLIEMLDELNDPNNSAGKTIGKYFDEKNIAYWMAFMILTGNVGDTTSHNLFLYSPRNSKKWYFIPWDNDKCFWNYRHEKIAAYEIIEWREGVSNYWGNKLFQQCLSIRGFRKTLISAMDDLMKNYLSPESFAERVREYSQAVKPYIYSRPDAKYAVYSEDEYDNFAEKLYLQIEENYKKCLDDLKKPMPFFMNDPVVTDDSVYVQWENAHNFSGGKITYDVELADDPSFKNVIAESRDLESNQVTLPVALKPGRYYANVTARNEEGLTQVSFAAYIDANERIYNAKCFDVR